MYEIIKKFLNDGGRCLLIEDGKPVGVVLTIEEYELLQGKSQISNLKSHTHPIGEAMAKEMDYPEASPLKADQPWAGAEISDIEATDDVTLEDLGVDELPY